ncbi:MAG: gliding motility-associated C-terminal domain-containing protein, partial [Bacteroidota bacterium]
TVCGTSYILNNQALLVSWEDGFAESSRSITESGTYIATINNSSGCTITDTVVVNLEGSGTAYLPNAFSPNNDNKNDKLCLFSSDELAIMNYLMRVYDRWGKLLFESDDVTTGWDGESNGKPLNSGTYLAIVSFSQEGCSTPVEIAELVHLLR